MLDEFDLEELKRLATLVEGFASLALEHYEDTYLCGDYTGQAVRHAHYLAKLVENI